MSHVPDLIVASHIEPVALVAENGVVLAFNGGFATLLGVPADAGGTVTLAEIADLDAESSSRLIGACIASPGPRPIRLVLLPLGTVPRTVEGFAWRCKSGAEPVMLLRIGRGADAQAPRGEAADEGAGRSRDRRRPDAAQGSAPGTALGTALAQLHEAEEIKSHMMAQISHDLRTPLNAILGLSEFILDEPFGPLDRHYHDYVDDMRHSGQELLELVDKVLQLTTSGHPSSQLSGAPRADLSDCLHACLRVVEPLARQKGLQILVAGGLELPQVLAESVVVKQVLYNLLGNAIKFTASGGTISVDGYWDGNNFAIQVIDSGRGITPDELKRVYEPFYRSGDSYSAAQQGSGLGLALAKRSVEHIGGRLEIESAASLGTCATVTLPAETAAQLSFA